MTASPDAGPVAGEEQLLLPFADAVAHPPRRAPVRTTAIAAGASTLRDAVGEACARRYPRRDITVEYIESDSVLVRSRRDPDGAVRLEVNAAYRRAPAAVADAIVLLYAGRPRRADRRRLSHSIHAWHLEEAPAPPSLPESRWLPGLHHDFRALLDEVAGHFPDPLDLDVTLGARVTRWVMGRHERRTPRSLVIVNPLLDHPAVEPWYLRFLLFHECLHEVMPPRARNGRIERHPREFREAERRHPDHGRVRAYELWLTGPGYPGLLRDARRSMPERRRRRGR